MPVRFAVGAIVFVSAGRTETKTQRLFNLARHDAGEKREFSPVITKCGFPALFGSFGGEEWQIEWQ